MKYPIIISYLFFLFINTPLIAQDWRLFYSEKGKFNILTPALMEEKENTIQTTLGELNITTYFINNREDTTGNYLYLINYYDLPNEILHEDSIDLKNEILLNSIDQNTLDINGELLYTNAISIGKHPGFLWRANFKNGTVKSRTFLVGSRFYMLQVFTLKEKALNDYIDKFLSSFTLLE